MQVVCKKCGKEFERTFKYRTYCEECSTKQYECKVCHKMYVPKRIDADYGCCSPECSKRYKYYEGRKKTYEEKYGEGIQSPFHRKELQDKIKENCLKHYGVSNHHQRQEVIEATKLTCQEKFGGNAPMCSDDIKSRAWQTFEKKHIERFHGFFDSVLASKYDLLSEYKGYQEDVILRCKNCGSEFRTVPEYLYTYQKDRACKVCYPTSNDTYSSKEELELLEFVRQFYPSARKLSRGINVKWEIDIYIPELKIGFEYNSTYWHSSAVGCRRKTHQLKTEYFLTEHNIKVYYLWDYWGLDMCKSIILSRLNKTDRIYARKCEIKKINNIDSKIFFDKNHAEGYAKCMCTYALIYNNEIVSAMSFRKTYSEEVEIARYASRTGLTVVGGFSKLLKYSLQQEKYQKLITYLYRDLCPDYKDSVYYKNGFEYLGDSGPILSYWKENKGIEPRQNYQKHLLKDMFPDSYSDDKTEQQILEENHIYAVWNSGNLKFELNNG